MGNRKNRKNTIQNVAIVLLSVTAVLLFTQTQLYSLGTSLGRSYLSGLFKDSSTAEVGTPVSLADVTAPVQVAVTSSYGHYGQSNLSTTDDSFAQLGTLLGEALGSAGAISACDLQNFQDGLGTVSVYYDFLRPLPLELLAGLTGSSPKNGSALSVRSLLLSASGSGVTLYFWDGENSYSRCSTYVTQENLSEIVNGYEPGNAFFAFELGSEYADLAPLSLFITGNRSAPVLSASGALTDTSALLTKLNFNPHTNFRYTEVSGTGVVVEGDSKLQIAADGTVSYQGGSDNEIRISSSGETPTLSEAVLGSYRLLLTLLSDQTGDAQLCLQNARQTGSATTVQFGLLVNGLPVRFSDGAPEATVTLSGSTVSSFTLRFRKYLSTEETGLLLPLRQAVAIARKYSGCALSACYVDAGGAAVSAQWLAN